MAPPKKEYFKSGPKFIRRPAGGTDEAHPARRAPRRADDYPEERRERRSGGGAYGYDRREGFEKRDEKREPMHVLRRPPAPSPPRFGGPVGPIKPAVLATMPPLSSYQLKKGLESAKAEIGAMVNTIADALVDCGRIREVELVVSFDADGTFMGFGSGGAATLNIRIAPGG